LEISRRQAVEKGGVTDHFHDMLPVVAESGSQVVKNEIRKIVKTADHREQVKFVARIFGLEGRAESRTYNLQ